MTWSTYARYELTRSVVCRSVTAPDSLTFGSFPAGIEPISHIMATASVLVSVRCPSGPLLSRPLRLPPRASCPGWAARCGVACPIPIKIHHQCYRASLLQGSPLLVALLSVPPSPFPACRPNQHIGSILQTSQRASRSSQHNKVGNQTALSSPPQPITASSEAAIPDQRLSRRPRQLWTF